MQLSPCLARAINRPKHDNFSKDFTGNDEALRYYAIGRPKIGSGFGSAGEDLFLSDGGEHVKNVNIYELYN